MMNKKLQTPYWDWRLLFVRIIAIDLRKRMYVAKNRGADPQCGRIEPQIPGRQT